MLEAAHQGYIYQDILGAYFVAQELARGKKATKFHFDHKKTPIGILDKFDDIVIYREGIVTYIQVKYSNQESQHDLTKADFSNGSTYDLALFDLFTTWKALHTLDSEWRICLAWNQPASNDPIKEVLIKLSDEECLLPGTTCFKFNSDKLWPKNGEVLSSWRALKNWSKSVDRSEFSSFLESLIIELDCPKSSLLQNFDRGLEKLLARTIERIGIGIYPNDHLNIRETAERICSFTCSRRSTQNVDPISCDKIAVRIGLVQAYGGVEQRFPVDENILVGTPHRVDQVLHALEQNDKVALTAEPGAGKSWFIDNLRKHLEETTTIVKHYCYIALDDSLALERITLNVLFGSLITQIVTSDEDLGRHMTRRYASNLEQLNILLRKIQRKTLIIVDGIDHIWRVYQKNRGGLTENEIKILEALSHLDCSNTNVTLLVVSQPIDQLKKLDKFHQCNLAPISQNYVKELFDKHALPDRIIEEDKLSQLILDKSNGNALYCKYLVDHAIKNNEYYSFKWLSDLPPYDYNLTKYYDFLFSQIQNDTRISYALCGADFSLEEKELQEITYLGNILSKQLKLLMPILRYLPVVGYSLYHESFKRYVIDNLKEDNASVEQLVYQPLISWLEKQSFFKSTKAFSHLLKLYFEIDNYKKIIQTISPTFIDDSLYNAQPINSISQNHNLQKESLQYCQAFKAIIIVAEQSKIVEELNHLSSQVLKKYLLSVQEIHGEEEMYRFLWNEDHLLIDDGDALQFFVYQAYYGKGIVHWSLAPKNSTIPYDEVGLVAIKLLETEKYKEFEDLVEKIFSNPDYEGATNIIIGELERYNIHVKKNWKERTPNFLKSLNNLTTITSNLNEAVERIISNEKFIKNNTWEGLFRDLVIFAKQASDQELDLAINKLSNYNWFRNWLVYLIKISELSQREFLEEELQEAFTFLVRDLKPFKGEPRVCDLYSQLSYIKMTFHLGLDLCKGNQKLLISCCEYLEKVTEVTTSLHGSFSGPLTDEDYLEIIGLYLPGEWVLEKYEDYYKPLGSRRYYSHVAEVSFQYATVLHRAGKKKESYKKFREGIQAITAYGIRKDRTLSEILDCSVPYQKAYGTLSPDWFYELYQLAMTVVTHTDGRSTKHYPIEWFEEFSKVYPNEALKFLACETLESNGANWHQESQFYHILKDSSFFNPTQWFLLCRSLPFASSEEIITRALCRFDEIDDILQDPFKRWLCSLPYAVKVEGGSTYSNELAIQFKKKLNVSLDADISVKSTENSLIKESKTESPAFPTDSIEDALAFLEIHSFEEKHIVKFTCLFKSSIDWKNKKLILRQIAKTFRFGSDVKSWIGHIFERETREDLYFNICLFVYVQDGWFHGLHHFQYLQRAYKIDPDITIQQLKEVSGHYLAEISYTGLFSANLVKALIKLGLKEEIVNDLFYTIFNLVKHRLPHPPDSEINPILYQGLQNFSQRELMVVVLIARLKTLTTFKTRGIIWSLSYIAKTEPESLFQPLSWTFSHPDFLLPIHRAILLQIVKDYIDINIVPDNIIGSFLNHYPTGFFLEDQHIRSFVNYNIELDTRGAQCILFNSSPNDLGFFPYIHFKYWWIVNYHGPLHGAYEAYAYKRDEISKNHSSYHLQSEKLITPIVALANAAYEIINRQYYEFLKELNEQTYPSYNCNLDFCLKEIILQEGASGNRPLCLAMHDNFPSFEVRNSSMPIEENGWILLASMEKEIYGESFKPKNISYSSIALTFGEEPKTPKDYFANHFFRADQYLAKNFINAPYDQPICKLIINDTLEYSRIIFVSPWIIKELGLTVNSNLHNGFRAFDNQSNEVIKMITWKEDYFGSANDGNEIPRLEGVAVLIDKNMYSRLLQLYNEKGWFVLAKDDTE